jgi:tetratricopeptide (TPR) repeat protein
LATRFGQDTRAAASSYRCLALWVLGYPDAALADADHALKDAREIGHAPTLMYALVITSYTLIHCGKIATATKQLDEAAALAAERGASLWQAMVMQNLGCILALTSRASEAVQMITSGITALRSTGGKVFAPWPLSILAKTHAELNQFDNAWRCIGEARTAVETDKEKWCEAEVHRVAGEIELSSPDPDAAKAEACFGRALAIARAAGEILGTACGDEHGSAVVQTG